MRWAMRYALAWVAVAGCTFAAPVGAPASDAPPSIDAAPPPPLDLRISADIDGRSELILRGTSITWMHYQYAAPGREQFVNLPTKLDAFDWFPTWPDVPDAENRDCACMSSTYDALPTAVPRVPSTIEITPIAGRRTPTVRQQPDAANDFTAIIVLDDVGLSGSAIYTFDVAAIPPRSR